VGNKGSVRSRELELNSCKEAWETDLGNPSAGANDLRRSVNLDYVMGDVYALVNKAKTA
jgi:hypothetical protein